MAARIRMYVRRSSNCTVRMLLVAASPPPNRLLLVSSRCFEKKSVQKVNEQIEVWSVARVSLRSSCFGRINEKESAARLTTVHLMDVTFFMLRPAKREE